MAAHCGQATPSLRGRPLGAYYPNISARRRTPVAKYPLYVLEAQLSQSGCGLGLQM